VKLTFSNLSLPPSCGTKSSLPN